MEILLTTMRGRSRLEIVPVTPIQRAIDEALKGRTIAQLAREWEMPRWVLDDLRHGRLKMPKAVYLLRMARETGISVEDLITPPKENGRRAPGGRRGSGKATASIS